MKKRLYRKPIIEQYCLDKDISLMMQTVGEGKPPVDPWETQAVSQSEQLQQNSFEANPFEEK